MKAVFTRSDGGLSVVIPDPHKLAQLQASGMTERQAVEQIAAKASGGLLLGLIYRIDQISVTA